MILDQSQYAPLFWCIHWRALIKLQWCVIWFPRPDKARTWFDTNCGLTLLHFANASEIVGLGYSTWVRWVVSTNMPVMQFNEFEYHFACSCKDVHLCFITSPGKMIFAVLELWLSPLQWVLNWSVFNIYSIKIILEVQQEHNNVTNQLVLVL